MLTSGQVSQVILPQAILEFGASGRSRTQFEAITNTMTLNNFNKIEF